jgi:hypothetical protein
MLEIPESITVFVLFIDNIEDSCMMSLPVFLIYEEGTTDKFQGVNDRHQR